MKPTKSQPSTSLKGRFSKAEAQTAGSLIPCKVCGNLFYPKNTKHIYCSEKCKQIGLNRGKRLWDKKKVTTDPDYHSKRWEKLLEKKPDYNKERYPLRKEQMVARYKELYHTDEEFRRRESLRTYDRHTITKNECSICGSNNDLQLHHLSYNKTGDCIVVCRKCHNQIHKNDRKEKRHQDS